MNQWTDEDQRWLANLVLAVDPANTLTLWGMGKEFCEEGQFGKAEFCLRNAADIADKQGLPINVQCGIWISLGRVLTELSRFEDAENWLRRAVTATEDPQVHVLTRMSANSALGDALVQMGRPNEAECFLNAQRALMRCQFQERANRRRTFAVESSGSEQVRPDEKTELAKPVGEVTGSGEPDVRGFGGMVLAGEARAQISQKLCGQAAASEHSSQEIRSANDLVIVTVRRTDAGLVLAIEVLPAALPSHLPLARFCVLDLNNHLVEQGYVGLHRLSDGRGVGELDLAVFDSALPDRLSSACTLEVVPLWGETLTSRERNDIVRSLEAAAGFPSTITAAGEAVLRAVQQRLSPPGNS